ncbi:hypothetical protein [Flavobacterium sp. DG2-3]|uniref:hypothetical protein n=1 Tax=Flavobacterium sp. DG2-3 TaxID=3068317 RepID=UPI00273DC36E|nr:hypothetical protein [Flavobacterium sp. DG2-3]MDP5201335.1 hypothetical protein [Flavobacterium sp. DG2-3]
MKTICLLLSSLLLMSCNVTHNKKHTQNFKKDFKFDAYCSCLLEGYGNKNLTSQMTLIDKSFYSPVINSVLYDELREIGIEEAKIMKKDSIKSITIASEALTGKKIQLHCLNFYNSKKLDSITKVNYRKWKNIKNIDSIINAKNPGF